MSGMLYNRKHWRCLQSRLLWVSWGLPAVALLTLTMTASDCPRVRAETLHRYDPHHRLHHNNNTHNSNNKLNSNSGNYLAVEMPTRHRVPPQHVDNGQVADDGGRKVSQCPNCVLYNSGKYDRKSLQNSNNNNEDSIRLEAIKRQILSKLGLKTKPNVTSPVPREVVLATLHRAGESRDSLLQQRDSMAPHQSSEHDTITPTGRPADSEPDDFYGRTSEIITFAEPGHTLNGQTLLEFSHFQDLDGDGSGPELRVKAATLWVRVDFRASLPLAFRNSLPDRNLTLWLFKVTRPPAQLHLSGKEFDEYTEMAASLPVTLSTLGWQKFDLTPAVRGWYSSGAASRERLRLLVDCSGCGDLVEAVLFRQPTLPYVQLEESTGPNSFKFVGDSFQSADTLNFENSRDNKDNKDTQRPFLVINTDPTATRRVRRRALNCSGTDKGQCCKKKFYVSFKQLGWEDWIIAPSGYYANYCRGDCGGIHRTPDTFLNYYAHVIEEYRKMDRLSGMKPCCAPLKFSSMSLIYFGPDSNIIKRDLPKMVVDECGCP